VAIVTAAQWKAYKGIVATTWDAQLAVIIPAAEALVEYYCNRIFYSATYTEYHDGDGSDTLVLRNGPVTSITSVKLVDPSGSVTVIYTYDASSYIIQGRTNKLVLNNTYDARWAVEDVGGLTWDSTRMGRYPCWPRGFQNVQVVYVGGYSVMPTDLQLAMYQYIDMVLASATQNFGDSVYESERLGLYQYKNATAGERSERFRNLFAMYRRPTL
jgi:hypothetical protein